MHPAMKKLLRRIGYTRMVERGLKSQRPELPDLSIEPKSRLAPASDMIGYVPQGTRQHAKLPDGFVLGNSHKQGLEVMSKKELPWAGGKKT